MKKRDSNAEYKELLSKALKEQDKIIDIANMYYSRFFSVCFNKNNELAEFVLKTILKDEKLKVLNTTAEVRLTNIPKNKESILDLLTETDNSLVNLEIQANKEGFSEERAEFYSSMLIVSALKHGDDYKEIKEVYTIFFLIYDIYGEGFPIYKNVWATQYDDGSLKTRKTKRHIIYVNGAYEDTTTDIGKIIHDFKEKDVDKLITPEIKEVVEYYKRGEGRKMLHDKLTDREKKYFEKIKAIYLKEGEARGEARGEAHGEAKGKAKKQEEILAFIEANRNLTSDELCDAIRNMPK